MLAVSASVLSADEGGVSFWLPGQYASFAAIAPSRGWSLPMQGYGYSGDIGASGAAKRGGDLALGLESDLAGAFITPTYVPDWTLWGATPAFSLTIFPGWNHVSQEATLQDARREDSDTVLGFGDVYPTAQLFWARGVHNWMAYVTGDVPVGVYDPEALAALGLGHWAVDLGGAYTYFDATSGWEVSLTAGLTYNFENPDTDYTSGIDSHLDAGLSRTLANGVVVGLVGYAYVQLTPDKGQPAALGDFESRVFALGPQIGYTFEIGARQIVANLRGYHEFAAKHRTAGNAVYLSLSVPLSPAG